MKEINVIWDKYFKNEKDQTVYVVAESLYREALELSGEGFAIAYGMNANWGKVEGDTITADKLRIYPHEIDRFFDTLKSNLKKSLGIK